MLDSVQIVCHCPPPLPHGEHLRDCCLGFSFWPLLSPYSIIWENCRARPLQERSFCWCDGITDVLVVNGILEQTVWKGWMLMVLIPSKPFGKVIEKQPIETNPALQLVWRRSSCSTVVFGTGVDEAQLPFWGALYFGDVPTCLTTNSAPFPSGPPHLWVQGSTRLGPGNNLYVFALTFCHSQHISNGIKALENV